MRYSIYFTLQTVAVIALAACLMTGLPLWCLLLSVIAIIASFTLAYRAVDKPLRAVQNGIYLLKEQDFTSSLRKVGQADADKVVSLFNHLMATLKAERLKSLEQNDFMQKLIQASPMGIAICNYDGEIIDTNQAFKSMNSTELGSVLTSLKAGESGVFRAGQSQIYRCTRSYFMDNGFRRPFFLVERLTDEILKAETAIFNKIVRTMGHEVNNTLGSVISVLQTLQEMHSDSDPFVADTIHSSIESCEKLGLFVKGYADVVKLPDAQLTPTDLNTLVTDTLPGLRHLAPADIAIETDLYPHPTTANIDTTLFERVLVNIVKNAVESISTRQANSSDTPQGNSSDTPQGKIIIATSPHTLRVIDNGPGIAPENADRLFTPFFSTKNQDRGLGLMLIADILRKHSADYTLTTTTPNDATPLTTFTITLP